MEKIKNCWPFVDSEQKRAIDKVILSNKLNFWTGRECKNFEKNFSNYFKRKYSLTFNSGSVALDIALKSLELKDYSEVIVSPKSYVSSATCVLNNRLTPVFSDISLETQNIELEYIKKKISKKTKAIIVVHLGGMPADMISIMAYAKKRNIKVIEDCSQAHGAKIGKSYAGSFGDIAVWSFCNDKIMNTLGEGGMLSSNNKKFYDKAWSLRDCGKNPKSILKIKRDFKFKWLHDYNGSNYRMTEIQATVGNSQLKKLKQWLKKRHKYANKISKILKNFDLVSLFPNKKNFINSYYRFYIRINSQYLKKGWSIERIIQELNKKNIQCNYGACPAIYKEKIFKKKGYNLFLANIELLQNNTISFVLHPNFTKNFFTKFEKNLKNIFYKASLKND